VLQQLRWLQQQQQQHPHVSMLLVTAGLCCCQLGLMQSLAVATQLSMCCDSTSIHMISGNESGCSFGNCP